MADVELTVKHGKDVHKLTLASTATLGELRGQLHTLTDVAPASQKIMGKGTLRPEDDAKTLDQLGIGHGAKLMLVGTKMHEVLQVSTAEEKAEHAAPPMSDTAQEEALLFDPDDKEHKKILEQGPPADAMPGVVGRHEPIPPRGITGVSDKVVVGKLRLTLKTESDELWIQSAKSTRQIPFVSITDVKEFPIPNHPAYVVLVLLMGKTSKYYLYWVPVQYTRAFKRIILGYF